MKFCKNCQIETERYKDGKCKSCADARSVAWKSRNKEKVRAIKAAWKIANRDKVIANKSIWYAANRDKLIAKSVAYNASHPDARRIHKHNRRARKRANGGSLSKDLSAKLFTLQKGKCACCSQPLGNDYHLDHRMPLALGGSNADDNMQLLRAICNMQKSDKHPLDFMRQRGFLL